MNRLRKFESLIFGKLHRPPPQGKVQRGAFWLLCAYLLCGLLRSLPGGWGQSFGVLWLLDFLVLMPLCGILLLRWLFGQFLWKVRNRLIVTYLLMGLAPVVLFASLALISLYIFSGQFAIFAATSEVDQELAQIGAENEVFALHVAHYVGSHSGDTALILPEAGALSGARYSGIRVGAFVDGKPLELMPVGINPVDIPEVPSWAGTKSEFSGIVFDRGQLFLRAINNARAGGHRITVITSLPLQQQNVDRIAVGLGTVAILPSIPSGEDNSEATATQADGKMRVGPGKSGSEEDQGAVVGGHLPKPDHFYDILVTFPAPLESTDWGSGNEHQAFAHVNSRPSLLYQRLFITSLRFGNLFRNILIGIAVFFGLLELIAFYGAMRLNRTITKSIRDLYSATTAIDQGDFAHRIVVKRRDQLAALSQSFNNMAASLARLMVEQREKQLMQNELAIAQEVQNNLFPHGNVSLPSLEVHGVCLPARTVSGDYYDFLRLDGDALGLALGDISGKGISAALLMATLHSAVRAYRFAGEELVTAGQAAVVSPGGYAQGEQELECGELLEEPAKILGMLNRHLYRSTQPEKYATLFLAHYDGGSGRLRYSNGGQLPPLLLRADDSVTRLDCGGTVVGLLDGVSYEQETVVMHPGDILVAYSDGVTEPENEFGEFGEDRLLDVVRRNRHLPLEVISSQVIHALRSWIGAQEQPDDITLVLARQDNAQARG